MRLSEQDCELFFKLHNQLLFYACEKLQTIIPIPEGHPPLPPKVLADVQKALYTHPGLIDEFVRVNPAGFSHDELEIVSKWKHGILRQFLVFRYLKRHAIFLGEGNAYGVLALYDPFEELLGPYLPV